MLLRKNDDFNFSLLAVLIIVLGLMLVGFHWFFKEPSFSLRILHTNDHHAHLLPVQVGTHELGGIARRKSLINASRLDSKTHNEPVLLLDAGDIFQGTLFFNQYEGQADVFFYNELQYDASTVGNHEFDLGQQALAKFAANADFPMLSANIQIDESSPLIDKIKPWIIFEMQGEKVGIFGLTTKETSILSKPGDGVVFTDPIMAAREAVRELKEQGVNKIIALTHIGIDADQTLATQVNDIDVIVGGHSHTIVGNMPGAITSYPLVKNSPTSRKVLVVTDWEWGKYLGDIRVGFDVEGNVISWQGSPRSVDERIEPNSEFQAKLRKLTYAIEHFSYTKIGESAVVLDGNYKSVRSRETNLGDLIADAMLDEFRHSGAQMALLNSGTIRNSISEGDITMAQVLEALPFQNQIVQIEITGEQLKAALENGLSGVEEVAGRFPQIAGFRFHWDPSAPAGRRIIFIEIANTQGGYKPYDPNEIYTIVTNEFLSNGNDGYSILSNSISTLETNALLSEAVVEYITSHSPISLQSESRIVQDVADRPTEHSEIHTLDLRERGPKSLEKGYE